MDCFFLGFSANPLAVNILSYASASMPQSPVTTTCDGTVIATMGIHGMVTRQVTVGDREAAETVQD
jgi:hypothetical protein